MIHIGALVSEVPTTLEVVLYGQLAFRCKDQRLVQVQYQKGLTHGHSYLDMSVVEPEQHEL